MVIVRRSSGWRQLMIGRSEVRPEFEMVDLKADGTYRTLKWWTR
jgi:hypothetical protein